MSQGQIQLNSQLGNILYDLCFKDKTIFTAVEIGTWRGAGSTECIISGFKNSQKESISFISLETNKEMYDIATQFWQNKLPQWAKLIHGRIIDIEEMDSKNLGYQHQDEAKWFEEDKKSLLSCPNVFSQLPEKIDFLFLDGGEFTTHAEFLKLKDRSRIIILDDTKTRKCAAIRSYVFNNLNKYKIIFDDPTCRNGIMGFETKQI